MYSPFVSAFTVRENPVPSFTTVIFALLNTEPDASVTVPRMVPLTDCASAVDGPAIVAIASPRRRPRTRDAE